MTTARSEGRRTRVAAAALLSSLLLAASPRLLPAASPAEEMARGKEFLHRGNLVEAETAYARALADDPADPERRLALAEAQSHRIVSYAAAEKNYRLLLEEFRTGKTKDRANLRRRVTAGLGRLLVRTGRSRDAIPLLKDALPGAEASVQDELRSVLALSYYEERLYDEALFELRAATQGGKRNSDALFNLKTIRTRLEPYQAGKIYSRVGDHEGAGSQFRKAIQYDPRFIGARLHLGLELLQEGKAAEALRELHRAESISPTYPKMWEIRYAEGQALAELKRYDDALAKYSSVLEGRPKFAPAQYEMGRVLEAQQKLPEAAARYALAIEGDPRTDYVRRLQAVMNRLGGAPSTLPAIPSPGAR